MKPIKISRKDLLRVLTYSENLDRACPRRWMFKARDGLTTLVSPAPLVDGDLGHQCADLFYRQLATGNVINNFSAVIDPWLERRHAFLRTLTDEVVSQIDEKAEATAARIALVMAHYARAWGRIDLAAWEILVVEGQACRWIPRSERNPFLVDYTLEDKADADGFLQRTRRRRWAFGGKIDLVVRSREDGGIWLVEHKFTEASDLAAFASKKLQPDPQWPGYAWTVRDPIAEYSSPGLREPLEVRGVLYNIIRRNPPKRPEITKEGKVSKAAIATTAEVYRDSVLRNKQNPDDYAEMIAKLPGYEAFFRRDFVMVTERELVDVEREIRANALETIRFERPDAYHQRQTAECSGPGRPECPYRTVCITDGAFTRKPFNVLGVRHPELSGDMAEPWLFKARGVVDPSSQTTLVDPMTPSVDGDVGHDVDGVDGVDGDPFGD